MNQDDFKKLLNEVLEPLGNDIKELKEDVQELTDVQENRLLLSVIELETTVKGYADSYKENQRNIERLDTRASTVEDQMNIKPPEDLKVPHFAE